MNGEMNQPPVVNSASRMLGVPAYEVKASCISDLQCYKGEKFVALTVAARAGNEEVVAWEAGDEHPVEHPRLLKNVQLPITYSALWAKRNCVMRLVVIDDRTLRAGLQKIEGGEFEFLPGTFFELPPPYLAAAASRAPTLLLSTLQSYRIWDLTKESVLSLQNQQAFGVIAVHPNGSFFASPNPLRVGVFTTSAAKKVAEFSDDPYIDVKSIVFSESGRYLAIGGGHEGESERLVVWEWQNGRKILDANGVGKLTRWIAFAQNEDFLVSVNSDSCVSLWNLKDPVSVIHFPTGYKISGGVALSENDQILALGTEAGIIAFRRKQFLPAE